MGRDVLQRGARWRVGNGKTIKIWQHGWIPRKNSPFVASYQIESMGEATVSSLIEESSRQWNEELIDGIVSHEEAALIKKIPLSRMDAEDVLIWPHSQDGQYSCKSGYRFLKDEEALEIAQDDVRTDSKLWKGIWTLPNKVKNLLWRACHNTLPTKASLVRRTIINDPLCDRCHEAHETPIHALWDCKELDTVWAGLELS